MLFNLSNILNYTILIYIIISIFSLLLFCINFQINKSIKMYNNSVFLSILILILLLIVLKTNYSSFYYFWNYYNIHFYQNILIEGIKYLVLINILVIFILSFTYRLYIYEFSIVLLLNLLAIYLLINSNDLIGIYLILEFQNFCLYVLIGLKTFSNFATEASLKYFILGSFSSSLFLFGVSLFYGINSLTNLLELKLFFNFILNDNIYSSITIAMLFLLVSLLFKLGVFPFHMYIPDVYVGAPSLITMLFMILQKLVILCLLFLIYINIFNYFNIIIFLSFSAVSSIIFGSINALTQSKLKKLLAYSTIVNSGFLLSCFCTQSIEGFTSLFIYISIYIILITGIFIIFLSIRSQINNNKLMFLRDFILLKKSNKILAFSFCLFIFSLAGLPPLIGFYSKFFLFIALIKENLLLIATIILFCTAITIFYYIRIIKIIFFEQISKMTIFYSILKINALFIFPIIIFNFSYNLFPKYLINIFEVNLLNLLYNI